MARAGADSPSGCCCQSSKTRKKVTSAFSQEVTSVASRECYFRLRIPLPIPPLLHRERTLRHIPPSSRLHYQPRRVHPRSFGHNLHSALIYLLLQLIIHLQHNGLLSVSTPLLNATEYIILAKKLSRKKLQGNEESALLIKNRISLNRKAPALKAEAQSLCSGQVLLERLEVDDR